MTTAGITSQYGFLYQRKVFIYYALKFASTNQEFTFEGIDDIDISSDDGVFSIHSSEIDSIQVKSGIVDESCFCRVICNWLLAESSSTHHSLILENQIPFAIDDSITGKIINYICAGKGKKRNSIARKTYDKYKYLISENLAALSEKVNQLLESHKLIVLSIDALDQELEEIFFRDYCQDITEYSLAKTKRLDRFLSYVNRDIDESIKAKKPFTLVFSILIKIIMQVRDEISDNKYIVNIPEVKKKLSGDAARIVAENASREVKQLFLVGQTEQFLIDGIVHELLYKDFRSVFIAQKELELINIEQDAHENYITALLSLDANSRTPKEVYLETIKTPITGNLLPDGSVYRKGCYIYLTGDDIDEENLISWGEVNE